MPVSLDPKEERDESNFCKNWVVSVRQLSENESAQEVGGVDSHEIFFRETATKKN
jgi:hypothetical protein